MFSLWQNKNILEGIVDKKFLGIISPLGMAEIESLNILDYVEDVAMVNIVPLNGDQQKIDKSTWLRWENSFETFVGPQIKHDLVILRHCGGHIS